jgi:glycosyltransferase involved in cell wall biosynthesis
MNDSPKNGKLLSLVIPLFGEEQNLKFVLDTIQTEIKKCKCDYELILVDDGSMDNTWAVIQNEAKFNKMIKALCLSRNFGKEAAICAGLEAAKGDAAILIDGDLQHPPDLIPEMVGLWRDGKGDIIEAVKKMRGKETALKRIGAIIFYYLFNKLSGSELGKSTDYKLLDRQVINAWLKMGERNLFFRGMTSWLGFKHVQIEFAVNKRFNGDSKWSFLNLTKLAVTALTAFSSLPLHLVTILGFFFLIFAVCLGINTLFQKIAGIAVSGFTTVILLQLIIGSLLMICLGIIGEYIARVYQEVKGRPRYLIKERIE